MSTASGPFPPPSPKPSASNVFPAPPPSAKAPGKVTAKRNDLQGLRAIAVLLVAFNHAQVPFFSGGYIGVDVFFVMSGYFITSLLLRDGFGVDDGKLGRISIGRFYARRARRILPAACLTLLVTSIAVYIIYAVMRHDFLETKPVLEDALASSLFFVNFHFMATANNYFAAATTTLPSPFQHFWSLSVEEQFYVVWPSLLITVFYCCRRFVARRPRRKDRATNPQAQTRADTGQDPTAVERQRRVATWLVGLVIVGGGLASLLWSIHATAENPTAAYFSTPVRVWEFGLGAGLALLANRVSRPLPQLPLIVLSWIGLAMIIIAAVFYSSNTNFPGYAALLPVVGSGLLILAGFAPSRAAAGRLLAIRPLTFIGDRSYTFYLWHYPVLVLAWQAAGHVLPVEVNLALLAGALALSSLTYACIENPLRFAHWLRGWRTAIMVPIAMGSALAAVLIPLALFDSSLASEAVASQQVKVATLAPAPHQSDPKSLWAATPIPKVVTAVSAVQQHAKLPKAIVPSLSELEQENSSISYDIPAGCQPAFGPGVSGKVCRLGDSSSKRVVAVIGDSHAGMWMPALIRDGKAQGFVVVPLDKPGCLLNVIHKNRSRWPCKSWYQWALTQDRQLHPAETIVSFELTAGLLSHPSTTTSALRSVLGQVKNGLLITDPPGQSQQPATCISQSGANMAKCSSKVPSTYVPLMHILNKTMTKADHPTIPTIQWFCSDNTCPMIINHTLTTRDRSHFTMEYSTDLAPLLGRELRPILTQLSHH